MCCLMSVAALAQFDGVGKGDIISINGTKAIVFSVDEYGHGTAMTIKALRGKKNLWCLNPKLLKNLEPLTSESGKVNTAAVLKYIDDNRISISDFPVFEWCRNLGEGWYIPSFQDMEVFVNYYLGNDQDFDWDSEEEFDVDAESVTPKQVNEKMIDAGGVPFMGNALPGAVTAVGVVTSTRTETGDVYIYQFNSQKNSFRFKAVSPLKMDTFALGRAFYDF